MTIAIVGAGAMGSLFGALLAEAGEIVTLVDVWQDHVDAVNADGLIIERDGILRRVSVAATVDAATVGTVDLCVVFVKSTHTVAAARAAARLTGDSGYVLTLQNGMGNADAIAREVDPARVIAGTTSHGATFLGPGRIRHAGAGPTAIGMWFDGPPAPAERVAHLFSNAGIATEVRADVRTVVWHKLLVNVGINAVTALTGIRNGELLDLPATRDLVRAAVDEAQAVARAQGVEVRTDAVDHVFAVARATAANRSSMGQDVDRRRTTEIGAINGFVVRAAGEAGLDAPVNRTLTALVRTLEAHFAQ